MVVKVRSEGFQNGFLVDHHNSNWLIYISYFVRSWIDLSKLILETIQSACAKSQADE